MERRVSPRSYARALFLASRSLGPLRQAELETCFRERNRPPDGAHIGERGEGSKRGAEGAASHLAEGARFVSAMTAESIKFGRATSFFVT